MHITKPGPGTKARTSHAISAIQVFLRVRWVTVVLGGCLDAQQGSEDRALCNGRLRLTHVRRRRRPAAPSLSG
jgi:hypothetical protein